MRKEVPVNSTFVLSVVMPLVPSKTYRIRNERAEIREEPDLDDSFRALNLENLPLSPGPIVECKIDYLIVSRELDVIKDDKRTVDLHSSDHRLARKQQDRSYTRDGVIVQSRFDIVVSQSSGFVDVEQ